MIVSKKLLLYLLGLSIVCAVLLSFALNFMLTPLQDGVSPTGRDRDTRDIQALISGLHSSNPLTRRDAITSLGERRSKAAILPLFSMIMNSSVSDMEAKLINEALYNISQGKILEYVIQLLSNKTWQQNTSQNKRKVPTDVRKKDENAPKPLSPTQITHLMGILSLSNKEEIEKEKYNLDFFEYFLNSDNNAIVLSTLSCILALDYDPMYNQVQKLYDKNLYFKIPVVHVLTKIGLNSDKYHNSAVNFLRTKLNSEEHPSVQEENYLALYMLTQHLLTVPSEIEKLMQRIVDLGSHALDVSLTQESFLLGHVISEEEVSLVKFFLSDFVSARIRSRLLNILWHQNRTDFLDTSFLIRSLQERRMDPKGESSRLELAQTALKILTSRANTREDFITVLNYISDSRMSFTVVSAINKILMEKNHEDLLRSLYRSIANDAYANSDLNSWVAYLAYRLYGYEELDRQLSRMSDANKISILHDLADCGISRNDSTSLSTKYGIRGEAFQKVLAQVSTGNNVCYFG